MLPVKHQTVMTDLLEDGSTMEQTFLAPSADADEAKILSLTTVLYHLGMLDLG